MIASLLPIVWVVVAKVKSGYGIEDNKNPREFLDRSKGVALRAKWAQDNAWESFAPFAAAVIIAHYCQVDATRIDLIASLFIVMRIFHGLSYLADNSKTRSIVWFIAMSCNVTLYILSFVQLS